MAGLLTSSSPTLLFIGREWDMEAVRGHLLAPETRLLTLTSPGGVGKTWLALHVAATRQSFACGVYLIPLAAITEPEILLLMCRQPSPQR